MTQSETRRATAQEKAARKKSTLEKDISSDERKYPVPFLLSLCLDRSLSSADTIRSSSHHSSHNGGEEEPPCRLCRRTSSPSPQRNHRPPLPRRVPFVADEDNSGDSQDQYKTPQDSQDEEDEDPEADDVDEEDEHENSRARTLRRKPTTKTKAVSRILSYSTPRLLTLSILTIIKSSLNPTKGLRSVLDHAMITPREISKKLYVFIPMKDTAPRRNPSKIVLLRSHSSLYL